MAIFMDDGTIDFNTIRANCDNVVFCLQSGPNRYRVKTTNLEQRALIESLQPGQSVFILGTLEGKRRLTIKPFILLPSDNRRKSVIRELARQFVEAKL